MRVFVCSVLQYTDSAVIPQLKEAQELLSGNHNLDVTQPGIDNNLDQLRKLLSSDGDGPPSEPTRRPFLSVNGRSPKGPSDRKSMGPSAKSPSTPKTPPVGGSGRWRTKNAGDFAANQALEYRKNSRFEEEEPDGKSTTWAICFAIGITVGVIDGCMVNIIALLHHAKLAVLNWAVTHHSIISTALIMLCFCLALVIPTALAVIYIAPMAAGSGLPEVITLGTRLNRR